MPLGQNFAMSGIARSEIQPGQNLGPTTFSQQSWCRRHTTDTGSGMSYTAAEHDLNQVLAANRRWAERQNEKDPVFFERLATGQSPKFLWVGCSDSRVPENRLLGLKPGEVFVRTATWRI